MNIQRRRGIALMIAIMVILFLTILTGALIKTQSGAFALMGVSTKQRDARIACRGLFDYCLYQLEHNRDWGKGGFLDTTEADPPRLAGNEIGDLGSRVKVESVDGRLLYGRLTDEGLHFRIEVANALTTGSGLTTSEGVLVSPEEIGLIISVGNMQKGSFRSFQTLSTVLELAPLFDSSVLTRGDLHVDGQEMFVASKDPRRNEIRAQGSSELPGLTKGDTRFLNFDARLLEDNVDSGSSDFEVDGKGLLYSGEDVLSEGHILDSQEIGEASQASGGRIVSKGNKRVDVYDLTPDNISQPTSAELKHDIEVPPGEFRFTTVDADVLIEEKTNHGKGEPSTKYFREVRTIDVCAYYDPPGSEIPVKIMRGELSNVTPNQRIVTADIPPIEGETEYTPVEVGSKFYLDSSFEGSGSTADGKIIAEHGIRSNKNNGSGPVAIDLASHSLQIAPNTRVRPKPRPKGSTLPPSSFELNVERGAPPKFFLGTEANDVILDADGDVKVGNGHTTGLGTVISRQGSVDLQPVLAKERYEYEYNPEKKTYELKVRKGVEIEASDKYDGLVIYAGKDVNIKNPNSAKWTFRGFVYAQGRFNFDLNNEDATFFGSVISRADSSDGQPSFSMSNGRKLGFIYDPEYLKQLTRDLPNNWTRLEAAVWNVSGG